MLNSNSFLKCYNGYMKSKIIISSVVVVTLIGAALFYVLNSPNSVAPSVKHDSDSSNKSQEPTNSPEPQVSDGSTPVVSGKFVDYSANKVTSASGIKILFFHAPWCPQCRALENDIKANTIPEGVTIFKVDYDSNQSLRQKYGITIQTSLVTIDSKGTLVKKYVAYNDPTLQSVIDNLLE